MIEIDDIIEIIKKHENPYPKDIFSWDDKEGVPFDTGRFHRHCYEIVENMRMDLIDEIKCTSENRTKEEGKV